METKPKLTAKQMLETYHVKISPQRLGAMRRKSRLNAGPPFRYGLSYPPPVRSEEEWAELEAEAELRDDMGLLGDDDDGDCIVLAARNLEDAKSEAEWLWQNRPHEGAIGYAVYSRDWGCRHDFHIDNVVMLGNVRTR